MSQQPSPRAALEALLAAATLATAGCGAEDDPNELLRKRRANADVAITVGSRSFTEQYVLGEIYAQALDAVGYRVETAANLGTERRALRALKTGEVDAYPEYTAIALTSLFGARPGEVPSDAEEAYDEVRAKLARHDLVALAPTPFSSASGVGTLTSTADEEGLSALSDLEGVSEEMTIYGPPGCRQRPECLRGLERGYGLSFKRFVPVDVGLRYAVLDRGKADLSFLFTTDPQLAESNRYTLLDDDEGVYGAANVVLVATDRIVNKAGPDFERTVEEVQEDLTPEVMQKLNARVDLDNEDPETVAHDYLAEAGFIK
jgi:osmoprotectant transport system substrate-binding protein